MTEPLNDSEHLRNLKLLSGEKPKEKCESCLRENDNLKEVPYWSKVLEEWFTDLVCPDCITENGYLIKT